MRRTFITSIAAVSVVSLVTLAGCAADSGAPATEDDAFSSNQATLLDFEFDGSLVTDVSLNDKKTIESQMLFTMGHLNHDNSVGRLDNLVLTNVVRKDVSGRVELAYHAKLPVAWGSKTNLPKSYDFKLPRDISSAAQQKFASAHKEACVDHGAHDVSAGSMWYHYRPQRQGCDIKDAEIIKTTATATRSALNTTGRFPEYHKIWEDDRLEVISIFAKFEANADANDVGIDAFNAFVRKMKSELKDKKLVTAPAAVSDSPGPNVRDVTIEGTLADGKQVKVTAFLVDDISSPFAGFDRRYESLTPTADLIAYNGHAGLGQNVRALAKKGRFVANKYQVFFMNGCDTFAYVDGSLAEARSSLNKSDPSGTKFMEFVTNAMPSFFRSMSDASSALISGFLSFDQPKTYEKMFQGIDRAEVVLVTGEEDNEFKPGMRIGK
jgi:hypothetical protein